MAGFLTMTSQMMCPHGGQVMPITENIQVSAGGDLLLRATDTFVIVGCPFLIVLVPHPCVMVQWVVPALTTQVGGAPALTQESVGLTLGPDGAPQGAVLINYAQPIVTGM